MSSWKSYGGIDKFDKTSNVTVNSIVANYFVIRKQITGDIDISGNLIVEKYLSVYNNATFENDVMISGTVKVDNALEVNGDITGNGNLYANNVNVSNTLFLGNVSNNMFLYGDENGIGVNTFTPSATFDISGNNASSLSVQSSQVYTYNTLVQNVNNKGIVLSADDEVSNIQFFNGNVIGDVNDSMIQSDVSGNMLLICENSVKIVPRLVVSDLSSDTFVNDATVSIHNDSSSTPFLYDVYGKSDVYLNNGIAAMATDDASIIFTNMITPDNHGIAIGGGRYPGDIDRSIGSIGCFDSSGTYIPNQTIVSGSSTIKNKTTLGINTYNPKSDDYALDINGPVHIDNGEITTIAKPSFQINKMAFYKNNSDIGIVIGTPNSFTDTTYSLQSYYTNNGGKTWNNSYILENGLQNNGVVSMNAVWIYDENYILTYGDNGSGYYSEDGGQTWTSKSFSGVNDDATDMYVANIDGTVSRVFIMAKSSNNVYNLYYFNAVIGQSNSNSNYITYYDGNSSVITSHTQLSDECGPAITGYGNYLFIAGGGIQKYDVDLNVVGDLYGSSYSYNAILAYDNNYIIAVGNGIISYTQDGGLNWNEVDVDGILRSISVFDENNAIAVGDDGLVMYTKNGSTSWYVVSDALLNPSGTRTMLDGSLHDVFIYDKNSFLISNIVESYYYNDSTSNDHGSSKILYNYLPNILNHTNNHVMDISGNMTIMGNITIDSAVDGSGSIIATGNTFYLLNQNVENLYIGTDASNIQIGASDVGKTSFNHSVDINGNITVNGYLIATGTTTTITAVKSLYIDWEDNGSAVYALDVSGINANASISGTLNVNGDVTFSSTSDIVDDSSGAFCVSGASKFIKNMVIKDESNASSDASGALYVAGGGYFGGNLITASNDVSGSLQVYGGSTFDGSMNILSGQMIISSGISASIGSSNGSFYISSGDAKINGNIFAMKNLYVAGSGSGYTFNVASGTSYFNGNVTIDGTGTISGGTWSSSDYRIKSNVVDLCNTNYSLDDLRPVYYYNEQAKQNQMGFIAHEVSEHFPFLVNGEKDGDEYQSVNYTGFIALLVKEIQSLKRRIAELET